MAFTDTWDTTFESLPPDTGEAASGGASRLRSLKVAIRERLEVDHEDLDDASHAGKHIQVSLREQAGDPTPATNEGILYTKDVGGITELFFKDSASNIKQITSAGALSGVVAKAGGTMTGQLIMSGSQILLDNNQYYLGKTTGGSSRAIGGITPSNEVQIGNSLTALIFASLGVPEYNGNAIFHAGDVGAGSGIDADLYRGLTLDFTKSVGASGYAKLGNGIIVQWGKETGVTATGVTASFPLTWPTACLALFANHNVFGTGVQAVGTNIVSTSQFQLDVPSGGSPADIFWFAIGS